MPATVLEPAKPLRSNMIAALVATCCSWVPGTSPACKVRESAIPSASTRGTRSRSGARASSTAAFHSAPPPWAMTRTPDWGASWTPAPTGVDRSKEGAVAHPIAVSRTAAVSAPTAGRKALRQRVYWSSWDIVPHLFRLG